MKNKILIILFVLILPSINALELDSFNVNTTQFPYNISFIHNVTLSENYTLYINRIDTDLGLEVNYPSEINFTNFSKTSVTWDVNLDDKSIINDTQLKAIFILSSNLNNITNIYQIESNITYDNKIVKPKSYEFIQIKDGHFESNITTDLLPWSGNFSRLIGGVYNTTSNISCTGDWLICPNNVTFEKDNQTHIKINYYIPQDAKVGTHNFNITINSTNESETFHATFIISLPELSFKPYVFTPDCYTEDKDGNKVYKMNCITDFMNYNYRQIIELNEYWEENLNETCGNLVETEYVVAGSVDEITWDSLKSCESSKQKLNSQYTELSSDYNTCRDDYTKTSNRLDNCYQDLNLSLKSYKTKYDDYLEDETTKYSEALIEILNKQKDAEEFKKEGRRQIYKILGIIICIILIVIGILIYGTKSNKWSFIQ